MKNWFTPVAFVLAVSLGAGAHAQWNPDCDKLKGNDFTRCKNAQGQREIGGWKNSAPVYNPPSSTLPSPQGRNDPSPRNGADESFSKFWEDRKREEEARKEFEAMEYDRERKIRSASQALRTIVYSGELWNFSTTGLNRARALTSGSPALVQDYAKGDGQLGFSSLSPVGWYWTVAEFGVWIGLAYWDTSEYLAAAKLADEFDSAKLRSTAVNVLRTCIKAHRSADCHWVLQEILRLRGELIPSDIDKRQLVAELGSVSDLRSYKSIDRTKLGALESHWQNLRSKFSADEAAWRASEATRRVAEADAAAKAKAARTESLIARARNQRSGFNYDDTKRRQIEAMVVLVAADRANDIDARAILLRWIHEDRGTTWPEDDPRKSYPTLTDEAILARIRSAASRSQSVTQSVPRDFEAQLRSTLGGEIDREAYQWSMARLAARDKAPVAPSTPANPAQAAYWKGSAYWERRDFKAAIPDLQEAVRLEPGNVEYLQRLAAATRLSGDGPAAMLIYEKALSLKPDDPYLHLGLAEALLLVGRKDEALKSANRAVALRPDSGYFRRERDELARRMQEAQSPETRSASAASPVIQPTPASEVRAAPVNAAEAAYLKGLKLMGKRDYKAAVPELLEAVRLEPTKVAYLARLAEAHRMSGDESAAVPVYQRALALAPDDPFLHMDLAKALASTGHNEEALKSANRAVALRPDREYFRLDRDAIAGRRPEAPK